MNEYELRVATPDDLDLVLRHRRRMFEDMGQRDPAALTAMIASSTPLLGRGLSDGSYRGWLVESRGVVVAGGGIITLEFQSHPRDPVPRRSWVVNVFTEPEHRRRGLARRLMQTMLAWSRSTGIQTLYLHASDEGRALYQSLGFAQTNEMRINLGA